MRDRQRYQDAVNRLRTRLRKTSLSARRRTIAAITFTILMVLLSLEISPFGYRVQTGEPSPREITAPRTIQYIDTVRTEDQREAAAEAVQDVHVRDPEVAGQVAGELEDFFRTVSEVAALPLSDEEKVGRIHDVYKGVDSGDARALLSMPVENRIEVRDTSMKVIKNIMEEDITTENLKEIIERAESVADELDRDPAVNELSADIAAAFITPNSVVDENETERRKEAARESVTPVVTTKLEGDVIVEKGELVTPEQVTVLKSLGFKQPTFSAMNFLYYGIFILMLMLLASLYLMRFRRVAWDSPGLLSLLALMVIVYTVIAKVLAIAAGTWSPSWGYLMPIAAVAIITAVLMDTAVAIMTVIVCSLLTGLVTGGNYSFSAAALLGGLLPSLVVSRKSSRHDLRRAGLYTALWMAVVALGASAATLLRQNLLLNTGVGFLNGVLCAIVAMGTLPFLENTFRVTTKTWLLELASPEQELLKELSINAPGTYSHSVMVANLAESAARAIGSDPLLARVAAYYHDVGKLKRPQFFIENQPSGSSPHDRMSPYLSTLVITSHVRDGVDLLEKHHLPPDIVVIVRQHHGSGLVKYFYEEALEGSQKDIVDENRFRYPFDKPTRRTAGILLLADAVEATARTLTKPSASAIEQMVRRIIDDKMEDGQLDNTSLTFNDVRKIKDVFSQILISAYHPRIDYPNGPTLDIREKNFGSKGKKRGPAVQA